MKKNLVQFDGSNFYYKVKKILPNVHLMSFNYADFAEFISKKSKLNNIYYVGEIRVTKENKKSELLYSNQQSLFLNLRKQGIKIKLGYLLLTSGKYYEKGVDVQIAVDMVRGALKDEYDICYLISSDSDLLPAVLTAKQEKKKIIYVGFENAISRALMKNCSSHIILKKYDLAPFIK